MKTTIECSLSMANLRFALSFVIDALERIIWLILFICEIRERKPKNFIVGALIHNEFTIFRNFEIFYFKLQIFWLNSVIALQCEGFIQFYKGFLIADEKLVDFAKRYGSTEVISFNCCKLLKSIRDNSIHFYFMAEICCY